MADRKHPKLSLKRKSTLNVLTLMKKDNLNREEKSDKQTKASRNEVDGETGGDVVIIESDEEEMHPGKRFKSSTGEDFQTVTSTRPTKSHFLSVDDDLQKLRLMFVKLKNPALDLKLLSDLPPFVKIKENACKPALGEAVSGDLDSLSALPLMCSWCCKRKPSDHSHLYDNTIAEILQVKDSNTLNSTEVSRIQKPGDSKSVSKEENYPRPSSRNPDLKSSTCTSSRVSDRTNLNEFVTKGGLLDTDRARLAGDVKYGEHRMTSASDPRKTSASEPRKTTAGDPRKIPSSEPVENLKISDSKDFNQSINSIHGGKLSHQKAQYITSTQNKMYVIKSKVIPKNEGKTLSRKISQGRPDMKIDYQPVDRTKKLFKASKHSTDAGVENTATSLSVSAQVVKGGNSNNMAAEKEMTAAMPMVPESVLQSCPLCQHVFKAGDKQIDKDGHIAACLSNSADDVMW